MDTTGRGSVAAEPRKTTFVQKAKEKANTHTTFHKPNKTILRKNKENKQKKPPTPQQQEKPSR